MKKAFQILNRDTANGFNFTGYSKTRFYKEIDLKTFKTGIYQMLDHEPSGKKLTRIKINKNIYFGLGWDLKNGDSLFSMIGFNKNIVRSEYTYKKHLKIIDKLILTE